MRGVPSAPADRAPSRWTWVDLRLVPVAVTIWVAALAGPHIATAVLAGVSVVAGGLAGLGQRRAATPAVLLAVLAALAVGGGLSAVRSAVRDGSPLRAVAAEGRTAEVTLELDGDPHVLDGVGASRMVADATVIALVADGGRTRLHAEVLLFGPAADWQEVLPGQEVRVRAGVALPRSGDDVVAVLSARGPPTPVGEAPTAQRAAGALRDGLSASADRMLPDRPAGLLPGLVVGDTRALDPVLADQFRRAGLSHLTAVSGANVAIVLAAVLWPLRRRAVDRRVQAVVGGLALTAFVVLATPGPSVVRAAAMGAVALLALAAGRPRAAVPALAAAVCVLLLLEPRLARDGGFALSVVATAAIVLLAPGWSRRLRNRGWPAFAADAVAVSAAAGMATAPLIAGLSGAVSLVSLPANLLAAPAVPPATVLGLAAAVVGPVCPPLTDALVWGAGWAVRWLVLVAQRAGEVPDAAVGWPSGWSGAGLLAVLLAATGWLLWWFPRARPPALAALLGLMVVGWPVRQVVRGWPPPGSVVVACDVGQGDALVLPTGPAEGVLVDAGPDVGAVDRCLDGLGIEKLPLVLLSHLDADHAGGLAGALDGRQVGVVATGPLSPADGRSSAVDALSSRANAERTVLVPGDRRTVGPATIEVLAPAPERATAYAEPNDLSLVVRVVHRGIRVLLTGDLSAAAQARILAGGTDLRADVLKVPHHGSADADPGFLSATGARVALVSVGAGNSYGHPAPSLLAMLDVAGMRVHRTDLEGNLVVAGDAGSWGVAGSRDRNAPTAAGAEAATGGPSAAPGERRSRVTPCRCASDPRRADVPPARGHRRGGVAAVARGVRRAFGRLRAPPRRRAARAGRSRAPRGAARRRPGPLAVRGTPADRRHRGAGGGRRAERLAGLLRQGARSRPDAGRGALRRQAKRRAGQGVHRRRSSGRPVPEGQLGG
jgi:competence protein ComEC